jgi:hypothetical protein
MAKKKGGKTLLKTNTLVNCYSKANRMVKEKRGDLMTFVIQIKSIGAFTLANISLGI